MNGQFLIRKPYTPPHYCRLPSLDKERLGAGSLWQCDCGKYYIVGDISPSGPIWSNIKDSEAKNLLYQDKINKEYSNLDV